MSLSLSPDVLSKYAYNKYFLETGTYKGGGVKVGLLCNFEHIISIEADEKFYKGVLKNYKDVENVHLYLGDSEKILSEILMDIDEPITFFLDSHIVLMNREIAKKISVREVPLIQELQIIGEHSIKTHTILIDDKRMMGFPASKSTFGWITDEWEAITEKIVLDVIFQINPDYEIIYEDSPNAKGDIIVAKPRRG